MRKLSLIIILMIILSTLSVFADTPAGGTAVAAPASESDPFDNYNYDQDGNIKGESLDNFGRDLNAGTISISDPRVKKVLTTPASLQNAEIQTALQNPEVTSQEDLTELHKATNNGVPAEVFTGWIDSDKSEDNDVGDLYVEIEGSLSAEDRTIVQTAAINQLGNGQELTGNAKKAVIDIVCAEGSGTSGDEKYDVNCQGCASSDTFTYEEDDDSDDAGTITVDGMTVDLSHPALNGATIDGNEINNLNAEGLESGGLTVTIDDQAYSILSADQGANKIVFDQNENDMDIEGYGVELTVPLLSTMGTGYSVDLGDRTLLRTDRTVTVTDDNIHLSPGTSLEHTYMDSEDNIVDGASIISAEGGNSRPHSGFSINKEGSLIGSAEIGTADIFGETEDPLYQGVNSKGSLRSDGAGNTQAQLGEKGLTALTYRDIFGGTLTYETTQQITLTEEVTKVHEFRSMGGVSIVLSEDSPTSEDYPISVSGPYVHHEVGSAAGELNPSTYNIHGDGSKFTIDQYQQANENINSFDGDHGEEHITITSSLNGDATVDALTELQVGKNNEDENVNYFQNIINVDVDEGSDPSGSITFNIESLQNKEFVMEIDSDGNAEWTHRRYWSKYDAQNPRTDDVKRSTIIMTGNEDGDDSSDQTIYFPDIYDKGYNFYQGDVSGLMDPNTPNPIPSFSTDDSKSERNSAYNQYLRSVALAETQEDLAEQSTQTLMAEETYALAQDLTAFHADTAEELSTQLAQEETQLESLESELDRAKRLLRITKKYPGSSTYEQDVQTYTAQVENFQNQVTAQRAQIATTETDIEQAEESEDYFREVASEANSVSKKAERQELSLARTAEDLAQDISEEDVQSQERATAQVTEEETAAIQAAAQAIIDEEIELASVNSQLRIAKGTLNSLGAQLEDTIDAVDGDVNDPAVTPLVQQEEAQEALVDATADAVENQKMALNLAKSDYVSLAEDSESPYSGFESTGGTLPTPAEDPLSISFDQAQTLYEDAYANGRYYADQTERVSFLGIPLWRKDTPELASQRYYESVADYSEYMMQASQMTDDNRYKQSILDQAQSSYDEAMNIMLDNPDILQSEPVMPPRAAEQPDTLPVSLEDNTAVGSGAIVVPVVNTLPEAETQEVAKEVATDITASGYYSASITPDTTLAGEPVEDIATLELGAGALYGEDVTEAVSQAEQEAGLFRGYADTIVTSSFNAQSTRIITPGSESSTLFHTPTMPDVSALSRQSELATTDLIDINYGITQEYTYLPSITDPTYDTKLANYESHNSGYNLVLTSVSLETQAEGVESEQVREVLNTLAAERRRQGFIMLLEYQ